MEKEVLGASLREAFPRVRDRRSASGRRHPLPALLALATAAMLEGARSIDAIAQWGRLQPPAVVRALGFTRDRSPCGATFHLVCKALDVVAFEAALAAWAQQYLGRRGAAIAIDGKGPRGILGEVVPGVRLVAAYCDEAGLVLAQAGGRGG